MAVAKEPVAAAPRAEALRPIVLAVLRSPATWTFVAVWLVCAAYLAATGFATFDLIALAELAPVLVLIWLTLLLTRGAAAPAWMSGPAPAVVRRDWRAWTQLTFLVAIILLVVQWILSWNRLAPELPLWNPLLDRLATLQDAWHIPPNWLMVPLIYFVVPSAVLLLLGARPRELGLGRGARVWRVAALWSVLQIIFLAVLLITGQRTVTSALYVTVRTTFNSGPFEEFLFRGALMTRIARLFGTGWGIALSSVVFGMLHISAETLSDGRGHVLAGLALGILLQGAGSIGYAVILHRTGNLVAGSISHVLTNVAAG